jgi:phosphoglucomutase
MSAHPRAGQPAEPADLVDVDALLRAYHDERPDPSDPAQRVAFGTSGHRGSSLKRTFNEAHVVAIAAAVCAYRDQGGITGPLFLGRDTHALSEPAFRTIVEVLAGHGVTVVIDAADGFTPTPVISHAILTHNRGGGDGTADGIVVTPSHNPPDDGGFKYNPPHGGPADTDVTGWIERAANELLERGLDDVPRVEFERAETVVRRDYVTAYVDDLGAVIDLDAIRGAGLRLGVDPLGGASAAYWAAIAERHDLDLEIVDATIDPTFRMVPLDHDGKIRMDCSSPYAMARLRELADRSAATAAGATTWASARRWCRARSSTGWRPTWGARWSRCRSASSGSSPGCSRARSASPARRAPARRSCAATAARGRPTRTGSSPACSRRR